MIDRNTERDLLKQEKKSDLIEEIFDLHDTCVSNQKRIVELINENDHLTLTYEPYFPPGQEPGYTYEELLEENKELHWEIARKKEVIAQQSREANYSKKAKLRDHCLTIAFDPWPLSEWVRLGYSPYKKGKYAQLCVGPIRVDFFVG